MGQRASNTTGVSFQDVVVPKEVCELPIKGITDNYAVMRLDGVVLAGAAGVQYLLESNSASEHTCSVWQI